MNRYFKLTAALAAFALLVVVMGLGTSQQTVDAQTINSAGPTVYVCTASHCNLSAADGSGADDQTHDNVIDIDFAGDVVIKNEDLPTVTGTGADINPKTVTGGTATIAFVHKSSGLDDSNATQIKAFHGNEITFTYTPSGGQFAVIRTVKVDNVKPQMVTNSPSIPLITTDGVNLSFSADITDGLSGYTGNRNTGGTSDIEDLNGSPGPLSSTANANDVVHGGIQLVVAGNIVSLTAGNFSKIDNGWRVSRTINSSAIQSISSSIPWYFETKDRAGNYTRTSGSIAGKSGGVTTGSETTTLIDKKYISELNAQTFTESKLQVMRNDPSGNVVTSNNVAIDTFANDTGTFTFTNDATTPLFKDAVASSTVASVDTSNTTPIDVPGTTGYQCPLDERDTVTRDTNADTFTVTVKGEDDRIEADQLGECGAPSGSSYAILGSNLITVDSEAPELVAANVTTGVGWDSGKKSTKTQKNSIQVKFTDTGRDDTTAPGTGSGIDASSVTASAFTVGGGHTVESVLVVGNSVYLTLSANLGSTERPSVSVQSGAIKDKAGNAYGGGRIPRAKDGLGPNLSFSKSADVSNDKVTITINTDEQLNAAPTVNLYEAVENDGTVGPAIAVPSASIRQPSALSFTYAHSNSIGGEFGVHVTAEDTGENDSSKGDKTSTASTTAFTFELDKRLNRGAPPVVSVSANENVATDKTAVEQVDPMIVTADFSMEGGEYKRDSYRTVELTSAKLKITFSDGTSETKTFDLATEVTSPDSIKYTIPILNPRTGSYSLTLQAKDSAGNVRTDGTGTTPENLVSTWTVIAAKPVDIDLKPGWNLISLPFQPANPAINSVIPATHPAEIVMTFDNANQIWMVSRRDSDSNLFTGDITVMTANTAYFIKTENFEPIEVLRPSLTTAAAAPPPPPAITVVEGWNLVPIVSNDIPTPKGIAADDYFGTLGAGSNSGWLKALTFDTLVRTWDSVTPGDTITLKHGDKNPCTGKDLNAGNVGDRTAPCQKSAHVNNFGAGDTDADDTVDGNQDGAGFDANDTVVMHAPVTVGKGYWLYATADGVIIP